VGEQKIERLRILSAGSIVDSLWWIHPTRSDLVQDTLARAFVTLGNLYSSPPNPLAWIARDQGGGVDARYLDGYIAQPPRVELREHRGELIFVFWYAHQDGEAVRALARAEPEGDHIIRLRYYFLTEDELAEVCRELSLPFRRNGYRFWEPTHRR
jgi:hypothetical protein